MNTPKLSDMTPDQKNAAIAEIHGWEWHHSQSGGCWVAPDKKHTVRHWQDRPNYCTDLNAIAEAVATLDEDTKRSYACWLALIVCGTPTPDGMGNCYVIEATASQRADALLVATGRATV